MLQQTEDGNLVLQQEDGQTHLISANGVTFADGQVQLAVSGEEGEEGQQVFIEGMETDGSQKDTQEITEESAFEESKEENAESEEKHQTEENNEEEKPEATDADESEAPEQSADSAIEESSQGSEEAKPSADEIKLEEAN